MRLLVFTLLTFLSVAAHMMVAQPSYAIDTASTVCDDESYAFRPVVNRNYDYAAMVKKQRLITLADDVMNFGYLIMLATAVGGPFLVGLDLDNPKYLWVYIPCGTAVLLGECVGFIYLSRHIRQKADNIQVASLFEYDVNDKYALALYNHHNRISGTDSPGIGLKITF